MSQTTRKAANTNLYNKSAHLVKIPHFKKILFVVVVVLCVCVCFWSEKKIEKNLAKCRIKKNCTMKQKAAILMNITFFFCVLRLLLFASIFNEATGFFVLFQPNSVLFISSMWISQLYIYVVNSCPKDFIRAQLKHMTNYKIKLVWFVYCCKCVFDAFFANSKNNKKPYGK